MHKSTLMFFPILLVSGGCAASRWRAPSSDLLVSFPNVQREGEQVVALELHIRNGTIRSVNKVPRDWTIQMHSERSASEISGRAINSATAIQNLAGLSGFLTIQRQGEPLQLEGKIVTTRDMSTMRTNFLTTGSFILKREAPNQHGAANRSQPNESVSNPASSGAGSGR